MTLQSLDAAPLVPAGDAGVELAARLAGGGTVAPALLTDSAAAEDTAAVGGTLGSGAGLDGDDTLAEQGGPLVMLGAPSLVVHDIDASSLNGSSTGAEAV